MLFQLDQVDIKLDKIKRNGFNETVFQEYYTYMKKVAIAFGAEEKNAADEMREVAELVIAITKVCRT